MTFSAPLIFLAKINQHHMLTVLFNAKILVPVVVRKEVLGPDVPPDEERLLTAKKSVELLDQLVEEHNFRISTRVYEIARIAVDQVHPSGLRQIRR